METRSSRQKEKSRGERERGSYKEKDTISPLLAVKIRSIRTRIKEFHGYLASNPEDAKTAFNVDRHNLRRRRSVIARF